ncbi:formyltetrahydrofolate deformylase [Nocardia sp. CDC160]|uniref:formyltetrahydrofolate deformylase n=1 Tax=Nocardia sp. CDC160 TaxID=3112166 RepID=UPI002DBF2E85|nr:formyltetrahydrofolate deformylase [Nocardia sp. CDC160]MEC3919256.1 formyltetrahydrofolate deformylase [Nocardia sp. CDC160]
MSNRKFILRLSTRETSRAIEQLDSLIADCGGSVVESGYHSDSETGSLLTRQVIPASSVPMTFEAFRACVAMASASLGPGTSWSLHDSAEQPRVVLLVSKESHCMHDLLGRTATGELPGTIEAVIGNHDNLADLAVAYGVKFHHVPFSDHQADQAAAFDKVRDLVDSYIPHAIVLTQFAPILPPELCRNWAGRAISIHHSFMPSVARTRPYYRECAPKVKLIGATCHYVTAELNAGPVIDQDITRVDHADTVSHLKRLARDFERVVMARALHWHLDGRVIIRNDKAVVFN